MRLTLAALALPLLLLLVPVGAAQDDPVEVKTSVLVIGFGNYDANKGTYVLDFYLTFRWDPADAPPGFTPERFEFMNGRASAKEKIFDETSNETGEREVWYRIQASLYSEPHFDNYPYDTQTIQILFEDSVYTEAQMVYVVEEEKSGLDEGFLAQGWRVHEPAFGVTTKDYRFGESYSRATFSVDLSRERFSTTIKTLLPPFAFMLVSGLSFFLHPSKIAQRLGLGTSMVISAVMYHISQTLPLPPLARLTLFDEVMLSTYAFLVASLVVTTLIAIDEDYWKETDHTAAINRWGGAVSVLLPAFVFVGLTIL